MVEKIKAKKIKNTIVKKNISCYTKWQIRQRHRRKE